MTHTNSPLVTYTKLSPETNYYGPRTHAIDRITPHCAVGQCSIEVLGNIFYDESRRASSNYGIGVDGHIGMFVEERNASGCSSSYSNDNRAITIECASDAFEPYAFNDIVYNELIKLCIDICKRNGKTKLLWFNDKDKALNYNPASDEMVITAHRWFVPTKCPGDWLYSRLGDIADKVTAGLGTAKSEKENMLYIVQVGAFSKKENAEAFAEKVKSAGFNAVITIKNETANDEVVVKKKSNAEIAKEIFSGVCSDSRWSTWGNGTTRVERLKAAGYDPVAVQNEVDELF